MQPDKTNEVAKVVVDLLARKRTSKFTGKLILELHMNDGGVCKIIRKTEEVIK